MRSIRTRTVLVLFAGVLAAATALAQSRLPRLPGAFEFAQSGDSPGKVMFAHASHVDETRPVCTSCHPRLFRILKPGLPTEGGAITHAAMAKGRACGACHDGKKVFGIDDCTMCHKTQ